MPKPQQDTLQWLQGILHVILKSHGWGKEMHWIQRWLRVEWLGANLLQDCGDWEHVTTQNIQEISRFTSRKVVLLHEKSLEVIDVSDFVSSFIGAQASQPAWIVPVAPQSKPSPGCGTGLGMGCTSGPGVQWHRHDAWKILEDKRSCLATGWSTWWNAT